MINGTRKLDDLVLGKGETQLLKMYLEKVLWSSVFNGFHYSIKVFEEGFIVIIT